MGRSRGATIATLVALAAAGVVAWFGLRLVLADPGPAGPGPAADQPTGDPVDLNGVPGTTGTDDEDCSPAPSRVKARRAQQSFVDQYGYGPSSPLQVNGVGLSQRSDVPTGRPSHVVVVFVTPDAPTGDRPSCIDGVQLVWVDSGPFSAF